MILQISGSRSYRPGAFGNFLSGGSGYLLPGGFVHVVNGHGDGLHFGLFVAVIEGQLRHIGAVFGDGDNGGRAAFQDVAGRQIVGSSFDGVGAFIGCFAGGGSNFLLGVNIPVADDDIHRFHRGFHIIVIEIHHIGVSAVFIHGYGNKAVAGQLIIKLQVPGFGIDRMRAAFHGGLGFGGYRLISLAVQIAHGDPGGHDDGCAGLLGQGEGRHIQVKQGACLTIVGERHNFKRHGGGQIDTSIQHNIQQGAVGHTERRIHAGCILDIQSSPVCGDPFGQLQPVAVFIACVRNGGSRRRLGLTPVIRPLGKDLDGLFLGCGQGHHQGCQQHKHQQENGFFMGTRHGQKASFMIREKW